MVARRLQGAADRKAMVRELRRGILDAVPALKQAVRDSADEFLPDTYAAELVPSLKFTTATSTAGDQVTVRLTVTARGPGGSPRHIGAIEDGDLRHPVFGRTRGIKRHAKHKATSKANPWVVQRVTPGVVTEPMGRGRPAVRKQIEAAVDRVLDQISGG